jgi:hypothetical protein
MTSTYNYFADTTHPLNIVFARRAAARLLALLDDCPTNVPENSDPESLLLTRELAHTWTSTEHYDLIDLYADRILSLPLQERLDLFSRWC